MEYLKQIDEHKIFFQIAKKIGKTIEKGVELRSFKGELVTDYARAVVRSEKMEVYDRIKELAATYRREKCGAEDSPAYGGKVNCKGIGKSLEITAQGNAISILLDFIDELDIINDDVNEFVKFYNQHIGFETDGRSMGIKAFGEPVNTESVNNNFEKLVFVVNRAEMEGQAMILTVSVEFPSTVRGEDIYQAMMPVINRYNMGIIKK